MKIDLHINRSTCQDTPADDLVLKWVESTLCFGSKSNLANVELSILITDIDEASVFNMDYRNSSGATNVLSFPSNLSVNDTFYLLGDLVMCAPLVSREAKSQVKSAEAHWAHLVIHGVLHLLGYDHQGIDDANLMEGLEIHILSSLGYANPYEITEMAEIAQS